jgi:molybdenum cofactor guanylyltransferase
VADRVADPRASVTAIVLAGGRSSRFGSPKLEARLDGVPLLEHAVAAVALIAGEIIVALPGGETEPALPLADVPGRPVVRFVRDPEPFGGPLVGLAGALAATTRPTAVVVGGDMPRLRPAVLRTMLDRLDAPEDERGGGTGGEAVRPVEAVVLGADGALRPLPLAVRVAAGVAATTTALVAGDRSLRAWLARLVVSEVGPEVWRAFDPLGETLIDIDEPPDLDALRGTDRH